MPKKNVHQPTQPLLLTVPVAAEMLQMSASKLYAWIDEGKFPGVKAEGIVRVEHDQMVEWIKSHRTHS